MTSEERRTHSEIANDYRRDGAFKDAGIHYTAEAYDRLSDSQSERGWKHISGIVNLLQAGICFRLSNERELCQNRCQQAELVINDARKRLYDGKPLIGLSHELVGDCYLIGDYGDYEKEYESAKQVYSEYENESIEWQTEDEFELGIAPFVRVIQGVDHEVKNYGRVRTTSLMARIDYKITHFPELLASLESKSEWLWEGEK
jgi:hypothetical protein